MPGHEYEETYFQEGYTYIAGMDEAGRGPLAGPVTAACAMFGREINIAGVNDSKKLSAKKRNSLFNEIISNCICHSIAYIYEDEIEKINILNATKAAMFKAVSGMNPMPEIILIDAVEIKQLSMRQIPIIKGDQLSFTIAAASILAKVSRDAYMDDMDEIYPEYGFAKHKGYGTKDHIDAILKHGPCPIHRRSFLRNILL